MHRDAPSCTVMHQDGFISSIITSELHRVPPNWFLLLYWVPICTVMHRVGFINFWIAPSTTKLLFIALYTSFLHRDAPRCTLMHQVAPSTPELALLTSELHWVPLNCFLLLYIPRCTEMHRDAPSTTELAVCILNAPSCTKLYFLFALWCFYFLFARWCTEMHRDAPSSTKLLYTVLFR